MPKKKDTHSLGEVAILCLYADGYPDMLATCLSDAEIDVLTKVYLFIDSRTSIRKRKAARSVMRERLPEDKVFQVSVVAPMAMKHFIAFYDYIPAHAKFQPEHEEPDAETQLAQQVLQERCRDLGKRGQPASWSEVAKRLRLTQAMLRNVRKSPAFETAMTEMAVSFYAYRDSPRERLRLIYPRFKERFGSLVGLRDEQILQRIWRAVKLVRA